MLRECTAAYMYARAYTHTYTDYIHVHLRTARRTSQPIAVLSVVSFDDGVHWTVYNIELCCTEGIHTNTTIVRGNGEKSISAEKNCDNREYRL